MDSSPNLDDFEYTVHGPNGIKGVKNGKEFPISEEDWRRTHPFHKDSGCTECTYVQDKESLFVFLVSRELKKRVTTKPGFVGLFCMSGWVGHSGFYIFKCRYCGFTSVDYPHGYCDFGLMYLHCDSCKERLPLEVVEEEEIYRREKAPIPSARRKDRQAELQNALSQREGDPRIITVVSDSVAETIGPKRKRSLRNLFGLKS